MNCVEECRTEIINQFMKELDEQFDIALVLALKSGNPVNGYRDALKLIDKAFEGVEAPNLTGFLRDMMMGLLNARVHLLREELKERNQELEEGSEECDDCCYCCEGFS